MRPIPIIVVNIMMIIIIIIIIIIIMTARMIIIIQSWSERQACTVAQKLIIKVFSSNAMTVISGVRLSYD